VSISTDWLIASDTDAAAVASIVTTEDRSFDDWPSVCLEGIGDLELRHLAALLRADAGSGGSHFGDLLYQESEEGPFVAAVHPRFIQALAAMEDPSLASVSGQWRKSEHLRDWPLSEVSETLSRMVAFARQAQAAGTPILQLMTL